MSISIQKFKNIARYVADQRLAILLRGDHGIGKSAAVKQFARDYLDLPVAVRRVGQMTESDIIGLPRMVDSGTWDPQTGYEVDDIFSPEEGEEVQDYTDFSPPKWLRVACERPIVIFIDELNRGSKPVRQALFELMDSRKIWGNWLHPNTVVFSAINGQGPANEYMVGQIDPAELDRWVVWDLDPTKKEWFSWATGQDLNRYALEYLRGRGEDHLEHKGNFEKDTVYPSRRSWTRLANTLDSMIEVNIETDEGPNDPLEVLRRDEVIDLAEGFVGDAAARGFVEWLRDYEDRISVEDILRSSDNPDKIDNIYDRIPHDKSLDLVEEFELQHIVEETDDDGNVVETSVEFPDEVDYDEGVQAIAEWIVRMPDDQAFSMYQNRLQGTDIQGDLWRRETSVFDDDGEPLQVNQHFVNLADNEEFRQSYLDSGGDEGEESEEAVM